MGMHKMETWPLPDSVLDVVKECDVPPRTVAYIYGSNHKQSAAQCPTHKLACYNAGWHTLSNTRNADGLARDVSDIVARDTLTLLASGKCSAKDTII